MQRRSHIPFCRLCSPHPCCADWRAGLARHYEQGARVRCLLCRLQGELRFNSPVSRSGDAPAYPINSSTGVQRHVSHFTVMCLPLVTPLLSPSLPSSSRSFSSVTFSCYDNPIDHYPVGQWRSRYIRLWLPRGQIKTLDELRAGVNTDDDPSTQNSIATTKATATCTTTAALLTRPNNDNKNMPHRPPFVGTGNEIVHLSAAEGRRARRDGRRFRRPGALGARKGNRNTS